MIYGKQTQKQNLE